MEAITRVTREPIYRSQGQRSRSQGHKAAATRYVLVGLYLRMECVRNSHAATLQGRADAPWLFLYTPTYSHICLGDRVAGVSYANQGHYNFLKISLFTEYLCDGLPSTVTSCVCLCVCLSLAREILDCIMFFTKLTIYSLLIDIFKLCLILFFSCFSVSLYN